MRQMRFRSWIVGSLVGATMVGGTVTRSSRALAADTASTRPATKPISPLQAMMKEYSESMSNLYKMLEEDDVFSNDQKRTELATKALPLLATMEAKLDQVQASGDQGARIAERLRSTDRKFLAALDDQKANKELADLTQSSDPTKAAEAKADLLNVKWWRAPKDAAAQAKLLDEAEQLVKAMPENEHIAGTVMEISSSGPASRDVRVRAEDIVYNNAKGPRASFSKQMIEGLRKQRELENKPLVIQGTKPDGSSFTTADLKGKVVLVDFWATWCGPCKAELPKVKNTYAKYHDKGLEIVGVSNDYAVSDLTTFLAADPQMPWPQIVDPSAAAAKKWHPLTTGFGIMGIPTMFLIDKNGICRTVDAREEYKELIPKLLAE